MKNLSHGATVGCQFDKSAVPPEYRAWAGMRTRCSNPSNSRWADYGGRGIRVCDRWQTSFENFRADMGPRPSAEHSLDRIDVNGNYEPDNCRWATKRQQAQNVRTNVRLVIGGKELVLRDAARQHNVSYLALYKAVVIRRESPDVAVSRLQAKGSHFSAQ
jgi:hypothetical protein